MEKRYFFDKDNDGHFYMLPYDKRGEWSQWVNSDLDSDDYKEYRFGFGINEWSFEKPEIIKPEEPIDDNIIKFENFVNFDKWYDEEIDIDDNIKEMYDKFINWLWFNNKNFDFGVREYRFKNEFFKVLKSDLSIKQKSKRLTNYLDEEFCLYESYEETYLYLVRMIKNKMIN